MSKRNSTLLIIILALIIIGFFGFLYFQKSPAAPTEEGPGTNFFSQFNPFGASKPMPSPVTPPVDISGYEPELGSEIIGAKLMKVSSVPVAGFIVFQKERLIDVPIIIPTTTPSAPYDFGSTTLKNGSVGGAVEEIQRFLNDTLSLGLEPDGVFDTEIADVIKQWQSDNKLVADGIVGAKTKAQMYSSVNQKMETTKPTPPLTEFVPAVRYVDKATGNIYQTFTDKIEERKFSTALIPKVYEAFFGSKGEFVVMRYLNADGRTVETFVGNLPKEHLGADTTPDEIKGSFLPKDAKDVSVSANAESIFYLFNVGDNMVGTTLNLLNNKKVQVFDSPFAEWLSWWPNNKMITLTTRPAYGIPGYMYGVDPTSSNKHLNKIFGGINGLTTLPSPNGKLVLYGDGGLSLSVYHTDTKVSDLLGTRTLPEKCVWDRASDAVYCAVPKFIGAAQYPDIWYQGEVSFSDQLWKVDIVNGNATLLLDPITITNGEEIDGIKLSLDENENYLIFVNKKDSFLWKLNLK